MLEIGSPIVGGSPRDALDVRIVNNGLVEVHHDLGNRRQNQPLSWPAYLPGEGVARRDGVAPLNVISYFSNGSMVRF